MITDKVTEDNTLCKDKVGRCEHTIVLNLKEDNLQLMSDVKDNLT